MPFILPIRFFTHCCMDIAVCFFCVVGLVELVAALIGTTVAAVKAAMTTDARIFFMGMFP